MTSWRRLFTRAGGTHRVVTIRRGVVETLCGRGRIMSGAARLLEPGPLSCRDCAELSEERERFLSRQLTLAFPEPCPFRGHGH